MAGPRNRRHILVTASPAAEKYRRHPQKIEAPPSYTPDSRRQHGQSLLQSLEAAVAEIQAARTASTIQVPGAEPGIYLQFSSQPGYSLNLTSITPTGAELVAVRYQTTADETPRIVEQATVFLKNKSMQNLKNKLAKYANDEPKQPKEQRHEGAFDPVSDLNLATLHSLWTDDDNTFPDPGASVWWEVWLRRDPAGLELQRLHDFCAQANIRVIGRRLELPDRTVTIVRATAKQLSQSLAVLSDLAEVRLAVVTADHFDSAVPTAQAEWVADYLTQLEIPEESDVVVALLDTGVNRGHPLLQKSLNEEHCSSCEPQWGVHDHDGHGTEMAGICLFGDLTEQLGATGPLQVRHRLESVKLLPPAGENDPELWGALTADASNRAELMGPHRKRTFCLATTSTLENHKGQPTLWSTSIDALASGMSFDSSNQGLVYLNDTSEKLPRRLFVVSAGNIHPNKLQAEHLDRSDLEPIQEPAQAWNALTVGAYTEKVHAPAGVQWKPLCAPGELSPWSTTSLTFNADWPIKPEILFEGGNAASDPYGITSCAELSLLTTYHQPSERAFTITWATSPATAQAARLSAQIMADNPELWPESVRGLMVHSARWTTAMEQQFREVKQNKSKRLQILRRYGYGVPSLERAPTIA